MKPETSELENQKMRPKRYYVSATDLADALNWSVDELRVVRRCLKCPVPPQRIKSTAFEMDPIIDWLAQILPRLDPATELEIRQSSITKDY